MKFFIDNNLSPKLAEGMQGFGEKVMHLQELFDPATSDVEWLEYIGKNNLILVTRDKRIRWHPAELTVFKMYKVGAFFLGGKERSRCQLIEQLVRNWSKMKELSDTTERPFAYRIPPKGKEYKKLLE